MTPPAAAQQQTQKPAAAPKTETKEQQKPDEKQQPATTYEETVVVSASKSEQKLVDAPATMTVIGTKAIEHSTSQNFAELLRAVPGVNITQVSARDINITTRGATGTLATGNLALLDGRSLYQDFFGFVMWDFLPVNLNEIKQIEVIRGPASAVWGANALNGVVNVITKSPREAPGTSAVFGFGGFDKGEGADAGTVWYVSGTHAQVINDRWAYKLSAGGYSQDPLARPTGVVPCDRPEVCSGVTHATYPPFTNKGTTQPKFDGRADYDFTDGGTLSFSGGVAGTSGIMHTGIGPFTVDSGSVMGYGKANYTRNAFHASFFTNVLSGDATNLLAIDIQGKPILFNFSTHTYDFEASNVHVFTTRHVVSYGGNLRFNLFDLSIAPNSENRTEFGVYGQDEIFLSKYFRLNLGARVDRFDYLNDFVFSPRTTFMVKPRDDQSFRVSYNRAYRAPSVINNFLDITIARPAPLTALGGPANYLLPIQTVGNPDLKEQSLDAFEIGYTGVATKHATVSAAFYVNKLKNDILFTEDTSGRYTAANPPPNWPLPPVLINFIPGRSLPGRFTYLNFGHYTQKGFELGVDSPLNSYVGLFANYSWQGKPHPKDFELTELNIPPTSRFNTGVSVDRGRFLGNLSVSYCGSAFWQDVLDDPFHGTTKDYTLVNGGFGVRWAANKVTTSIKATNIGNQEVQQHVFGDIVRRQIVAEFKVQF